MERKERRCVWESTGREQEIYAFERRGHAIEVMALWDLVYLGLAKERERSED